MEDKIIVTNRGALIHKYGTNGFSLVSAGLKALVAADKERGVKTAIVYLDDPASMKKCGGKPVAGVKDYRGTKAAIDAIFARMRPDYLMIVGAPDVVPHQDVSNPAFSAGDDDQTAWGDLPYACDTPYSRDPARFVGPTRVVSRLPDLTGADEPSHLVALLETAAGWKGRAGSEYARHFGLSAAVWKGSTTMSLEAVFGGTPAPLVAPPSGPGYPNGELTARMHFINCHGAPADPTFYGQKGTRFPTSLTTAATKGAIREGTVAAVECCFGGELYDSVLLGLDQPICQSYLRQGAYAYLGSTTIAYGPADDNGAADWICQFFLLAILDGASVGRAGLMARQQFVERCAQMDPIDLKTLAQFCVYGDPSVHPVVNAQPDKAKLTSTDREVSSRFKRAERRAKLKQMGDFLAVAKPTASKPEKRGGIAAKARTALTNIAEQNGLSAATFTAFPVRGAARSSRSSGKVASAPARYYVAIAKRPTSKYGRDGRVAVVAKELSGRVVDYVVYHERGRSDGGLVPARTDQPAARDGVTSPLR